jgi:hypothetical protein
METGQEPQATTIKVGRDRVTISGNQVIIDACHSFADWQVREFARIPIYFQDKKYFLCQKAQAQKPFVVRYTLELWPEDNREPSRTAFDYNEEIVAERDGEIRGGKNDDIIRAVLLIVFPFLGLLWSDTKDKLARFGILSRTVTGLSNFIVFGLLMLDGIFAKMLMMGSMRSGKLVLGGIIRAFSSQDYWDFGICQVSILWVDCALFCFLLVDLLWRYGHYLQHGDLAEVNLGFGEWITFFFKRKKPEPSQDSGKAEAAGNV